MGPPGTIGTALERVSSLFQHVITAPFSNNNNKSLGMLWEGADVCSRARDGGELITVGSGSRPHRVAFRNRSTVPLLLCWVSERGDLYHFYQLPPSSSDSSSRFVLEGDHVENTVGGHAFCVLHVPEQRNMNKIRKSKNKTKIWKETSVIVGGYRASSSDRGDKNNAAVDLVTISRAAQQETSLICCRSPVRKRNRHDDDIEGDWCVRATRAKIDPAPYDTTDKVYECRPLGGWPCRLEPGWNGGDAKLERRLAQDLKDAARLLPSHARDYLKSNCPVWVNASIQHGPKACPVRPQGCCYHPNRKWLQENGLSTDKHLCVEINDGPGYRTDAGLWGSGGVMVHEMSHAYHHRMLPGGYDNREIKACYEAAMQEGLYESVRVKGPQGPVARAYACDNPMEYFAELSAAFLGGNGDDREEYNKWFPFNRSQLREHDPRAYRLLRRLWKVEDD